MTRQEIIESYENKPWKKKNFATKMLEFAMDEGDSSALSLCESIQESLETLLESDNVAEKLAAKSLLKSVHYAISGILETQNHPAS